MRIMKVGIVMPVRNCLEYTREAIKSIKTVHEHTVYVIDDHSDQPTKDWLQSHPHIVSFIDPVTKGLAGNWNLGIRAAFERGANYVLVVNNDILLNPHTIDNLVKRMEKGDLVMATGVNVAGQCPSPQDILTLTPGEESETEHPDFSCFMISPETIKKIGYFDENYIGAYVEDCDFHARITLAFEKAVTINQAPYYHYASRTIIENPKIVEDVRRNHSLNEDYFRGKWGHVHVSDVPIMRDVYFKTPFNDQSKTIKDW